MVAAVAFRADRDIWATRERSSNFLRLPTSARLKVHFANWHHTPYTLSLSLPYDDFSRPIPLIISRLQTPFRCVGRDFMGTYGVRVTRGPVIPANLAGTLSELHPFIEKGTRNRCTGPSTDSTRRCWPLIIGAEHFLPFTVGATLMRGPRSTGNKLIGERRLLIIVSNGELAP